MNFRRSRGLFQPVGDLHSSSFPIRHGCAGRSRWPKNVQSRYPAQVWQRKKTLAGLDHQHRRLMPEMFHPLKRIPCWKQKILQLQFPL